MSTEALEQASTLPGDDQFGQNLIAGRWQYPAAPYEFEIRNPSDSTIITQVPLSSRFDVADAVQAARESLRGTWADPATRASTLRYLVDRIIDNLQELATLQALETGLTHEDSVAATRMMIRLCNGILRCGRQSRAPRTGGVSGHILSWGLPLVEVVTSVLPALAAGDSVVIKPSLRGALSPVAFAQLAKSALPQGVVNLVQGTGNDVGAELMRREDLTSLHVRASERTINLAERAHARTGVPLRTLRGGGNTVIVGQDGLADLKTIIDVVVCATRMNSAGGPLGAPLLAVHSTVAKTVVEAVVDRLSTITPAPLPTEPLRRRALYRVEKLVAAGARPLLGAIDLPNDVSHRMGWRMRPTVLSLGSADHLGTVADQIGEPLGPVLGVVTFDDDDVLTTAFAARRHADGIARIWASDDEPVPSLPHGLIVTESLSRVLIEDSILPSAWIGGKR